MSEAELALRVEAGDLEAMIAFLAGLPEAARTKLAKKAEKELARTSAFTSSEESGSYTWKRDFPVEQEECARAAVLATRTASELAKWAHGWFIHEDVLDLWRVVKPSWLRRAAEIVVSENDRNWLLANALVREGLADRPTSDHYVTGILSRSFVPTRGPRSPASQTELTIAQRLIEEPSLLENEVWRLFELEGGGENSLAAHDKYTTPERSWATALLTLMKGGHLSRERLLSASLSALERDFAAFRVSWFARFYEQLEPTKDERKAHVAVYARLLASSIPATASFALAALKAVDRGSPLAASVVLPHVGRVLAGSQKGPAKEALALLSKMAEREPAAAGAIARVVVIALSHASADVQKGALDLLEETRASHDDVTRGEILARVPGIAASLRKRAAGWGAKFAPPAPEAAKAVTHRAADPGRIEPILTLDALVDLCAHVLEDDGDPALLERVLDGISRSAHARSPGFLVATGPLLKRARVIRERHEALLRGHVARVVLAWLEGSPPEASELGAKETLSAFFAAHAHGIACRVASGARAPLLSLPTHAPAWIAPAALVQRVLSWPTDVAPSQHDMVLALLRLAREGRAEALDALATGRAPPPLRELAQALTHALGGKVSVGPDAALWVAAARGRAPLEDDVKVEERHPGLGPDAGLAARPSMHILIEKAPLRSFPTIRVLSVPPMPADIPVEHPTVMFHAAPRFHSASGWYKEAVRWASTLWPGGLEAFFADGVHHLGDNLDWSTAFWENAAFLEPLACETTVMGPMATLLLALGLAAKEPGEKSLAVDATLAAFQQGRLDGGRLGSAMAELLPTGFIKAKRWASTLAVVAGAGASHATEVKRAIERSLRGDPDAAPRDESALVLLLVELAAETGARVVDREAAAYLRGGRHRKIARAILD